MSLQTKSCLDLTSTLSELFTEVEGLKLLGQFRRGLDERSENLSW